MLKLLMGWHSSTKGGIGHNWFMPDLRACTVINSSDVFPTLILNVTLTPLQDRPEPWPPKIFPTYFNILAHANQGEKVFSAFHKRVNGDGRVSHEEQYL